MDKLQGTEDQLLALRGAQWKDWMGLVRKAGVKINNIFLTRLRHLIKINSVKKLVAVLRCQRQELTSSGDYLVIGFSIEVQHGGSPEIKQTAWAAEIQNYCRNRYDISKFIFKRPHVHPFCAKLKTEAQRINYILYIIIYYILY